MKAPWTKVMALRGQKERVWQLSGGWGLRPDACGVTQNPAQKGQGSSNCQGVLSRGTESLLLAEAGLVPPWTPQLEAHHTALALTQMAGRGTGPMPSLVAFLPQMELGH